ncbi:hypothetical protein B4135_2554 [Caldibacillus debilis]|uniref:Uncharacterized protein n=1 Tax=Caldibacillus debilis TaxID=301148 RepID=A0A150LZD4_9BACI|nr:hypothetical protein B4135_2554 [Caldibacillus debilis]
MPFDGHWIRQSDEVSLSMGFPSASVFPEEATLSLPSVPFSVRGCVLFLLFLC